MPIAMHIDDAAVDGVMERLRSQELTGLELRTAVGVIADALPALFGVDGSGILLLDEDQVLRYVASTDSTAHLLESVQETTGRGPCVQALVDNTFVRVTDLEHDERWPDLAGYLVPSGIRAILGVPIRVAGSPIGSLNVYRRAPYEWDESDQRALDAFDRLIGQLLLAAMAQQRTEAVVRQLEHALGARVEIERAVGVLMAAEDLTATSAFERIRQAARSSRRSVKEVASDVVRYKKLD